MTIRKTPVIVTFLLLALAVPTFAFAGPGYHRGDGPRDGRGYDRPALAPEKQEAFRKIMDDHYAKAAPLRKEMGEKRAELEYLSRLDKTEPATVKGLLSEISALGDKLDKLHEDTAKRVEKEIGIEARGYGMHRGGGYGDCGWRAGYDGGPRGGYGYGHGGRHHGGRW